jgi:hypothetical protein|tara:strand:- start:955 stop:1221 length:267 start_codon:yes stop_codon:yes gene_type:complete
MKTIIKTDTNLSLYIFNDDVVVDIQGSQTSVGDPVTMHVWDCNLSNVTLIENVTPPADWTGHKYFYTATDGWQSNPDWVDPATIDDEE